MSKILILHQQYRDYTFTFKNLSQTTLKTQRYVVEQFVRRTKLTSLEEINRPLIEHYIVKSKIEKGWSAKTIKNTLNTLRLFLDWCVSMDFLESNPASKIPSPKLPKRLPKSLNKEESLRLLEWARVARFDYKFERFRALAILAVLLYTGIRKQELLNLKLSDVDFQKRTLFVECGKGQKDRVIPLNYKLIQILQDYLNERTRLSKNTAYFFSTLRGNGKMSPMAIKRIFERIKKESGVYAYPHLMRHTFATLMLEGGCDLFTLSKLMGHGDVKTTTIYLSTSVKHSMEQIHKHPLSF